MENPTAHVLRGAVPEETLWKRGKNGHCHRHHHLASYGEIILNSRRCRTQRSSAPRTQPSPAPTLSVTTPVSTVAARTTLRHRRLMGCPGQRSEARTRQSPRLEEEEPNCLNLPMTRRTGWRSLRHLQRRATGTSS